MQSFPAYLLFCCISSCIFFLSATAQQSPARETNVTFRITNASKEPVAFATIAVISVPDTVHKQQQITDTSGLSVFRLSEGRPYLVRISSIAYNAIEKSITIKSFNPIFNFTLARGSKSLAKVVVTASKPLMRQEDDKTIVDPENLVASSTNAYEVMEKIPGLYVDQDGNIYLNSTTPAMVYINGREQKMSAADMASLLKSLPPYSISSIEILRTPSAKYDASSSGGIVNVVLKKGVHIGLTGSITAGLNQGRCGNQFIGMNLNNSKGPLTTYLTLQYSRRNTYEEIKTDRLFAPDSILSQDAYTKYPTNSYYFGYGIGY